MFMKIDYCKENFFLRLIFAIYFQAGLVLLTSGARPLLNLAFASLIDSGLVEKDAVYSNFLIF